MTILLLGLNVTGDLALLDLWAYIWFVTEARRRRFWMNGKDFSILK